MLAADWLIPASLTPIEFWALVLISVLTSTVTAMTGVGGGAALLAVMANMLPAAVVIPVHGWVQLGSNVGRLVLMRRYVRWSMLGWFVAGCLIGSLLGGQLAVNLPAGLLQLLLGGFILYCCWLPVRGFGAGRSGVLLGALTSFISMFIGAAGPFVISSIRPLFPERHQLIGTMAALMSVQHGLKVLVFGLFGFAFSDWLGLILLMILSGLLGTVLGKLLLDRIPNEQFSSALKVIISVMALKLLWDGFSAL